MRIGEILIGSQLIDAKALEEGLDHATQKAIPIGRALRALKYISEENLNRALDAQTAIKMGLQDSLAVSVLRYAYQTNRSFVEGLKSWPGTVGKEKIPPGLLEALANEKSLETTQTQQRAVNTGTFSKKEMDSHIQSRNAALEQLKQNMKAPATTVQQPKPSTEAPKPATQSWSTAAVAPSAKSGDAPQTSDQLIKEADALLAANKVIPAEKSYALALRQMDDEYGTPPSKVVGVATKLANLYASMERFNDALPLYKRVLDQHTKTFGPNSFEVGTVLEHLADLKIAQKQFSEAQSYIEQALQITQQQKLVDLIVAGRLLKKMAVAQHFDKPSQRTRLGELALDANIVSSDKLQAALSRSKEMGALLGMVLRSQNALDAQQLESLMLAQLLIKQRTITAPVAVLAIKLSHSQKVPLRQLCDAGKWLLDPERNDETYQSLVIEQEKLLGLEENHGADHPEVLAAVLRLAELHLNRKDKASAETFYMRAVRSLEKQNPQDKIQLARLSEKLAQVYCQQQRFGDAQPLLLKSLEYRTACGAGETMETAKCLWLVAKVELAQSNHATALSFLRNAKTMFDRVASGSCPKQLLDEMATCSNATGLPME